MMNEPVKCVKIAHMNIGKCTDVLAPRKAAMVYVIKFTLSVAMLTLQIIHLGDTLLQDHLGSQKRTVQVLL